MKYKYSGLCLFLFFLFSPTFYAEDGPQIEMLSPQGTVKGIRQVSVRFSEQMVSFGDPRDLIDPSDIDYMVKTCLTFKISDKAAMERFGSIPV